MKRSIQITAWSALAALAVGSMGCTVTADPPVVVGGGVVVDSGVTYADVGAAPVEVDIGTYPQTYYGGRPFYFYGDHWYYRDGGRWAYYQHEPVELSRQRGYIQQAPMAPRGVEQRRVEQRGVEQAPMAHRPEEQAPVRRAPPPPQRRFVGHPEERRR